MTAKAYIELGQALGGPSGLLTYLMMKDNQYEKLALANAKAVQGLSPKITVWNTGGDAESSLSPIHNIMQSLPPLLSTIQDQTGICPPNWLAQMPKDPPAAEKPYVNGVAGKHAVNGIK